MANIPIEWVLYILGTVALALIVWKFGKALARAVLVLAVLAVVGAVALALFAQAQATSRTAQVAMVATSGAGLATFALVVMALLALASAGTAGYFWLRWRIAERQLAGNDAPGWLPRRKWEKRKRLSPASQPEVYHIVDEGVEVGDLDLETWGWE